ncbi:pilus assembly protein Flp/PilA [Marinococcus luteus]|uniref:Pilus assembly protein Flp/PilA n=1 Tax=Marinococcus luteus TaxID=1122204 RepID=A0A1H2XR06_9BACI|nr:Flp family type IVb pilin [Marinococcus luteus]SDW95267.1 pilus assembly protein Flp/PilA [Marinococcus luteus]
MVKIFKNLVVEEEGQGMTEYGLILGLIAVGVITALVTLGDQISGFFTDLTESIPGGGE